MKSRIPEDSAVRAAVLVSYANNVQEIEIRCSNGLVTLNQIVNAIRENTSFPALRKLSVLHCNDEFDEEHWDGYFVRHDENDLGDTWSRLKNIIHGAPLLEEVQIKGFHFFDLSQFQTFATIINDAPCPLLC